MDALLLMLVPFVGFIVAYRTYGRFLARKIFRLDDAAPVPSKLLVDGIDYVPTRKGIIFGHHYTSIAGTGPIVGPAIGIIWGWLPAMLWVVLGSIFMGAVHDFGALVVSMRNRGLSLSEVVARYVTPRMRTVFFAIIFLELWIVIAVFCIVIAKLFTAYPGSVFPIWMEIPIAIALGYLVYKRGGNVVLSTAVAVTAMYVTVVLGHWLPVSLEPGIGALPAAGLWVIILLVYAYIASTLPVTTLLQPRDYINAWQLFVAMGLLIAGVVASAAAGRLHVVAPAVNSSPAGAPPFWPFLFVTIACGAISGFHSLVAGGTTAKQVSKEGDTRFVGYGSMLMEGALAVLVIVAVAAGIGMGHVVVKDQPELVGQAAWQTRYASWGAVEGGLPAAVGGAANLLTALHIPKSLGLIIIGVFIVSFAGTTLDTATRIQRYAIGELATSFRIPFLPNRWGATALAVVTAGALAFSAGTGGGGAMKLWPMFGAVNQLLAALALLAVTLYLRRRGRFAYLVTALPCLFMLAMTTWAVAYNQYDFLVSKKNALLSCINGATLLLALWMVVEASAAFFRPARTEKAVPQAAEAS